MNVKSYVIENRSVHHHPFEYASRLTEYEYDNAVRAGTTL